jgi:hypothetical protein
MLQVHIGTTTDLTFIDSMGYGSGKKDSVAIQATTIRANMREGGGDFMSLTKRIHVHVAVCGLQPWFVAN